MATAIRTIPTLYVETAKSFESEAARTEQNLSTQDYRNEYISLTDITRYRNNDDPRFAIQNGKRNRFVMTFSKWIEQTGAIGLTVKAAHLGRFLIVVICGLLLTSCHDDDVDVVNPVKPIVLNCMKPDYLKMGDKVALISPSYFTPMENVEKTADILRSWGLEPVIGPNVGKVVDGKYAGTVAERVSDIRWVLSDPGIKAIICNRGGYGTIQLIDQLTLAELKASVKWLVGFSDISTLHGLLTRADVMSIHGTMSSFLANGGTDETSTLMRDLLMGKVPRYEVPAHKQNITGMASGVLVGGNLCTFVPNLGSQADATMGKDLILFVEEVGESMHNIDRQMRILQLNGVLDRCKGIILGEFTSCGTEFTYESVEAMLHEMLKAYNIPVLCGFPAGHGDVNLPLVMGANVTIDVRTNGASLLFNIDGDQQQVNTADITAPTTPASVRMRLAGKRE